MDARQEGPDGWITEGISLEVLDADRAVGERTRQAVFKLRVSVR